MRRSILPLFFALSVAPSLGSSSAPSADDTSTTQTPASLGNRSDCTTLYVQAGAMRGIQVLAVLARLEELTGEPISNLFNNMEGGSVAGFLLAGANIRKSDNPESPDYHRPRYSMLDGLNMFVENTPNLFPPIPGRLGWMALGQTGDALLTGLGHVFGLIARDDAVNALHKDFMYDPAKLEVLYKHVFGENTRLSASLGTLHVPFYNMSEGHVQFFTVQRPDSTTPPSHLTHGDPKLWEVAMAATANSLAYSPYIMKKEGTPYVAFDGALFHKPITHAQVCGPGGTLVQVVVNPLTDKPLAHVLQNSRSFRFLEKFFGSNLITHGTPDQLVKIYGNSILGLVNGGLSHVQHYIDDINNMIDDINNMQRKNTAEPPTTITIAPPPLDAEEDPSIKPGLSESFVATPKSILKIIGYATRELTSVDLQLKDLAIKLLGHRVHSGHLSEADYQARVKAIEENSLPESEVWKILQQLAEKERTHLTLARPSAQAPLYSCCQLNS